MSETVDTSLQLLVVDNSVAMRGGLKTLLSPLNANIQEASNGFEALAILERNTDVALILSDMVMPEMGGTDLFDELIHREIIIPIVMLTGHPLRGKLEKLQDRGLAAWLLKPPTLERLSKVIKEVLCEAL